MLFIDNAVLVAQLQKAKKLFTHLNFNVWPSEMDSLLSQSYNFYSANWLAQVLRNSAKRIIMQRLDKILEI